MEVEEVEQKKTGPDVVKRLLAKKDKQFICVKTSLNSFYQRILC